MLISSLLAGIAALSVFAVPAGAETFDVTQGLVFCNTPDAAAKTCHQIEVVRTDDGEVIDIAQFSEFGVGPGVVRVTVYGRSRRDEGRYCLISEGYEVVVESADERASGMVEAMAKIERMQDDMNGICVDYVPCGDAVAVRYFDGDAFIPFRSATLRVFEKGDKSWKGWSLKPQKGGRPNSVPVACQP